MRHLSFLHARIAALTVPALACLPILLAGLTATGPAAAEPIRHEARATSTATVEVEGDRIDMRTHTVRLLPYVAFERGTPKPRLATVSLDVHTSTHAEGVDPDSKVSVAVDDLSGPAPRRLASFSAPGNEGAVIDNRYFDVVMPGCCAAPDTHHIHSLETGALLFRSTGPATMGSTAWIEAPNAQPPLERWASVDTTLAPEEHERGIVAKVSYGGPQGALSTLEIRAKTDEAFEQLEIGLSHDAALSWLGGKADRAEAGSPGHPVSLWAHDGQTDPAKLSGFQLVLSLEGRRLAVIPVSGDRLVAAKASLAHDVEVAQKPIKDAPIR
ncbi:hypothetical protein [Azospirillum sp. SYSU D00513]|uniref:hypothetical protein n=1 Tax=Azospirillum sp. SYSU D00513 TaxID=2812561 RepID=UPI001A960541|nr:hypothetical protein [Azospirillum sp. SYSU D00513]